jgi:hypothetical protein
MKKTISTKEFQRLLTEKAELQARRRGQIFITHGGAQMAVSWLDFHDRQHLLDGLNAGMEFIANRCKSPLITERRGSVFLVEPDETI